MSAPAMSDPYEVGFRDARAMAANMVRSCTLGSPLSRASLASAIMELIPPPSDGPRASGDALDAPALLSALKWLLREWDALGYGDDDGQPVPDQAPCAVAARDAIARAEARDNPTAIESGQTDNPECTDCGGGGVTYQSERRCACQLAEARSEGGMRERVARVIGSWITHDDQGGPDTYVLHDAFPGDYDERTARVYALADAIDALYRPLASPSPGEVP